MEVPYKLEMMVLTTIAIKLGVSLYPYSGKNRAPMYGDYEAQRHWMEITVNLPIKDWYRNSTNNDLMYWGLDYPPLTAYHSYLAGSVAKLVDPAFVELFDSRGYESLAHQFFMRMTVLLSDLVFFVSALYYCIKSSKINTKYQWVLFGICSHPGLILIDYGHFQYNCVSLGLALWAITFISQGRNVMAAIAFSAALNFKQMELYHALPIFFYLLAACEKKPGMVSKLFTLACIGIATIVTFGLIWYPFMPVRDLLQVVARIFPFNRGIFEDYVANFWCSLNVLVKIRRFLEPPQLARYCLLLTAVFSLPCGLHLYFKANFRNFLVSMINISLAFFLFSYHVHEKSILLVALPVSLAFPYLPLASLWFLCIAHFSMVPLYFKDDLMIPSIAILMLYLILAYNSLKIDCNRWVTFGLTLSAVGCVVLTVAFLTLPPPVMYPYLWTLLISVWSFVHFSAFLLYFLYVQFYHSAHCLKVKLH